MDRSENLVNQADTQVYDEVFFTTQGQPNLRKQVNDAIHRLAATTGKSHSLLWRQAYLELESTTGFRVPDSKKKLDAVEKAGLMEKLLEVVRCVSPTTDFASEMNNAIPAYIPSESNRSKWESKCLHESSLPSVEDH